AATMPPHPDPRAVHAVRQQRASDLSTLQQQADRVKGLEAELQSSREEVGRLTQAAAAKVERSELEAMTRRAEALDEELRQAREGPDEHTSDGTSRTGSLYRPRREKT